MGKAFGWNGIPRFALVLPAFGLIFRLGWYYGAGPAIPKYRNTGHPPLALRASPLTPQWWLACVITRNCRVTSKTFSFGSSDSDHSIPLTSGASPTPAKPPEA